MEDEYSQNVGRQRRATANRNYAEDVGSGDETEPKKRKTSGGKKQAKRGANDSDDENTPPESGPSQKRSRSGARSQESDSLLDGELDYEDDDEIPAEDLEDLETGQIMRVYVQDFMCHHKLTVEFGRNVNFVTGNNGSGKSAIVAALQICFGARASSTGRDKKISNMIREGTEGPAILRVTLRNEGTDAYKPADYGERIIVERKITKSGAGGGYKIMSKHGTVVSTDKKELEAILRTFNIYVDNPCCVLNQEDSKRFIQGAEKEKYEFFLKATGLKLTKEELEEAEVNVEQTNAALVQQQKRIVTKKDAADVLKRELDDLLALTQYEDQIANYLAQMVWLSVYEVEEKIESMQPECVSKEAELASAKEALAKAEAEAADAGNVDELKAKLEEIQEEQGAVTSEVNAKKKIVRDKTAELDGIKRDIRTLKDSKAEFASRLNNQREEIAAIRARALEGAKENERLVLQKLEACKDNIRVQEEKEQKARLDRQNASQRLADLQQEARNCENEVRQAEGSANRVRGELERLADGATGRVSMFGNNMVDIMRNIKSAKFQGEVFGPIGMHVKLKEGQSMWGEALEKVLGTLLSAFVVTNIADQRKLNEILRAAQSKSIVILQKKAPRYAVESLDGFLTVNDVAVIDSDVVFNCIIDQARIDLLVLAKGADELQRKCVVQRNGQDSFAHPAMKGVIYPNGYKTEIKNGNRAGSHNHWNYRKLLVSDVRDMKESMKQQIVEYQQTAAAAKELLNGFRRQVDEANAEMNRMESIMKAAKTDLNRQVKIKSDLDAELAEIVEAGRIDLKSMEDEEEELRKAVDNVMRQEEEQEVLFKEVEVELKGVKNDLSMAQRRYDALLEKIQEQEKRIRNVLDNARSRTQRVERAKKDVAIAEKLVAEMHKERAAVEVERQKAIEHAETKTRDMIPDWNGERIALDGRATQAKLEAKIKTLRAKLQKAREEAGLHGRTVPIVTERFEKAKADYKASLASYKKLRAECDEIEHDFKERTKKWSIQLKANSKIVKGFFNKYLQKKGFAGTVKFDHHAHTLHIECQVDNANDNTRVRDVRQLSGGERSYTTLCLLLALGHVIEAPFRLLDEYDVFLDEISRKMTLNEIQKYALMPEQRGRQFIIVTPQNLNDVVTNDQVRIKRLQPPNRQSAHGLQQQTLEFQRAGAAN